MDMDAQLFTMDLLLALMPMVLVLGMTANAMSGVTSQIHEYVDWYSSNIIVNNALDVLIKTPGDPPNWSESYPPKVPAMLGLANYTFDVEPYVLDDKKVGALNYLVNNTPLYQITIPRLLGDWEFTYINLSFRGATANTSNLSISFARGSRDEVSNIYAAQRLAMFELEKILNQVDEISRFSGENNCSGGGVPGIGQPVTFYMSFFVTKEDLNNYDFWLVGEKSEDENVNADGWIYDEDYVFSQPGNITDCSWVKPPSQYQIFSGRVIGAGVSECNCPSTQLECKEDDTIHKFNINSKLTEGGKTYYAFIELSGTPPIKSTYYIMRVPRGVCPLSVKPSYGGFKPVIVTLEVGR